MIVVMSSIENFSDTDTQLPVTDSLLVTETG